MPTTPRKNSLGGTSRRRPLKAHIPYRRDNPEVGKKTGIAIQHVADGFDDQRINDGPRKGSDRFGGCRYIFVLTTFPVLILQQDDAWNCAGRPLGK